MRCGQRNTR